MLMKMSINLLKSFPFTILMKSLRILAITFNELETLWSPFWTNIHSVRIKSKLMITPTAQPVLPPDKQLMIIIEVSISCSATLPVILFARLPNDSNIRSWCVKYIRGLSNQHML